MFSDSHLIFSPTTSSHAAKQSEWNDLLMPPNTAKYRNRSSSATRSRLDYLARYCRQYQRNCQPETEE